MGNWIAQVLIVLVLLLCLGAYIFDELNNQALDERIRKEKENNK
jgi:hypothetical protein